MSRPADSARRRFLATGAALGATAASGSVAELLAASADAPGSITDIAGIRVGHFTHERRPTGCTVIICEQGAVAGVDVRGSAPGTRETDLLNPVNTVRQVHAIVLAGGSAFGLEAATGVMRWLEEHNVGYETPGGKVPIVPAAVLYDLGIGDPKIRPDANAGYRACAAASTTRPAEGSVGAGAGASIGKLFGLARAMKGGVGTAAIHLASGLVVGAIVAVNALGDIVDPGTGRVIAGARTSDGRRLVGTMNAILNGEDPPPALDGTNTTIGVVATNAKLTKTEAAKMAQMAHDGLARAINPVHLTGDGDTVFALATGGYGKATNLSLIGALGAEMMSRAIVRAVGAAKGLPGLPGMNELK